MSEKQASNSASGSKLARDVCGKCGATRIDQQLGLESTPEQYVERMVEVFREVRRVLAAHGTVWLNLGDSYAAARSYQVRDNKHTEVGNNMPSEVPPGLKQKDLVGIPWRVAFALQADGWYLRSDIIWSKPNPMPESVTDRPTKAHEYVFLLSKAARYYFDAEAVREPHKSTRWGGPVAKNTDDWKYRNGGELVGTRERDGREFYPNGGRNIRSVWEIATQPYPEAHFATFPEELARRCIVAGCPEQVCRVCGKARERITKTEIDGDRPKARQNIIPPEVTKAGQGTNAQGSSTWGHYLKTETLGFTDCAHADYRPGIVLDPFIGSGTVAFVARKLGRHSIGIDLNESYLQLAARRLQQQSLFAVTP